MSMSNEHIANEIDTVISWLEERGYQTDSSTISRLQVIKSVIKDRKHECFKDKRGLGFGYSNLDEEGGFTVLARVPENLLSAYVKQKAVQYLQAQRDRYRDLAKRAEDKAKIIHGVITLCDEDSLEMFLESLKHESE